jgi:hypothetical protein
MVMIPEMSGDGPHPEEPRSGVLMGDPVRSIVPASWF